MSMYVSYEQLVELAKKPLVEAEGENFFKEFSEEYKRVRTSPEGNSVYKAYQHLKKNFLKQHCPPIEFIGEGSSRAAYALDGGLCLKIAKKPAGVAQNKAEAYNCKLENICFPQFYNQCNGYAAILVECISPCHEEDEDKVDERMQKHLGISLESSYTCEAIGEMLEYVVDHMEGSLTSIFTKIMNDESSDRVEAWSILAAAILKPKNEAQKVLRELAKFSLAHKEDFLPGDITSVENWGFGIRNGQVVPIVLDAGFSEDVWKAYY